MAATVGATATAEGPLMDQKTDLARVLKSPGGKEWMEAFGADPESPFFKDALMVGADAPSLNQPCATPAELQCLSSTNNWLSFEQTPASGAVSFTGAQRDERQSGDRSPLLVRQRLP